MNAKPALPSELAELIGLQLRLAQLHFFEVYFDQFGETGVSPAEFSILALLAEHNHMRQGVIGDLLRIKRSNMSKVMRGLEQRALIVRQAPEDDGRAFDVSLTEKGRQTHKDMSRQMLANDRRAAANLTDTEQAQLLGLLHKARAPFKPTPANPRNKELAHG